MPERTTLVLFDIDGTLLTTGGVGLRALATAVERVVGRSIDPYAVPTAGRLDPLITGDFLRLAGVEPTSALIGRVRGLYAEEMTRTLGPSGAAQRLLGAVELVGAVAGEGSMATGVLTGNFAETGLHKLTVAGFDTGLFEMRIWGDESPHDPPAREHLPGVALERAPSVMGRVIDGSSVVIIGDTPDDVSCARAHGCRVIGVTTGKYDGADLGGADLVVDSLEATGDLVSWILG